MLLLRSLKFPLVLLAVVFAFTANATHAADAATEREQQLLAVLRSDAPPADKALTCKKLAIEGSSESVAELAKLLPDPQLSSWARIALEAIPGEEADAALRTASESLEGLLLVGTINSIGVRRDAAAVDLLTGRLEDSDAQVASAAAVALGRIGNAAASESLQEALATAPAEVRSAVAEGLVLSAERLHADGQSEAAVQIYDEVRTADVPLQRILEATRGAILSRDQEGIALLLETFQSPDKKHFQLALSTAREFPGGDVDQALASEMVRTMPDAPARAALIIQAMADRPETVVLSAIVTASEKGDKQVRLSAIDALRRVGDESCLATLLETAADADADLVQAAQETLAELSGAEVDAQIVAMLPDAQGKRYTLLLELIGQRRIDAVPEVVKALEHPDRDVRHAALMALGETVTLKRLPLLLSHVIAAKHPEDAVAAQQALRAASVRMPDREACAAELAKALDGSPAAVNTTILEILGEVGGTTALETIAAAAKSDDDQLQDTGSRLLGKWNSTEAAPVLLDLAKTAPAEKYRVRALRGYIGLARKFAMPEQQRAEMCRNALNATNRASEHKLVLDVLQLHPSLEGLQLALQAGEIPALKEDATQAALVIAQKVGGKGVDVAELLSAAGLEKVELEIIDAKYGAGANQRDVTGVLTKQAQDSPLISLPAEGYNANFGGDPAPGVVKQLKIKYRINGKEGEATFAENALIVLPLPK